MNSYTHILLNLENPPSLSAIPPLTLPTSHSGTTHETSSGSNSVDLSTMSPTSPKRKRVSSGNLNASIFTQENDEQAREKVSRLTQGRGTLKKAHANMVGIEQTQDIRPNTQVYDEDESYDHFVDIDEIEQKIKG